MPCRRRPRAARARPGPAAPGQLPGPDGASRRALQRLRGGAAARRESRAAERELAPVGRHPVPALPAPSAFRNCRVTRGPRAPWPVGAHADADPRAPDDLARIDSAILDEQLIAGEIDAVLRERD